MSGGAGIILFLLEVFLIYMGRRGVEGITRSTGAKSVPVMYPYIVYGYENVTCTGQLLTIGVRIYATGT